MAEGFHGRCPGTGPGILKRVVGIAETGFPGGVKMTFFFVLLALPAVAAEGVRKVKFLNYPDCLELANDTTKVVLGHHSGGRVLSYAHDGKEVLYLDPGEAAWGTEEARGRTFASAGRFDIGPEYIVPRHEILWSGPWEAEITGDRSARLTSQRDEATGVRLIRDFVLAPDSSHLKCTQRIENVSDRSVPWCHWSRTFAKGGGIVVVPIGERPRRFPKGYVMYPERNLIDLQPEDPQIRWRGRFLEILGPPKHPKLGMDAHGWLACQLPNDAVFVKVYDTPADKAYNEVAAFNTSVWYPDQERIPTIELEPIGPANKIEPGESASFTENWWILGNEFPARGSDLDLDALAGKIRRECGVKE